MLMEEEHDAPGATAMGEVSAKPPARHFSHVMEVPGTHSNVLRLSRESTSTGFLKK